MPKNLPIERLAGASGEAKYRSLYDIWKVRGDQRFPRRLAKTAIVGSMKLPPVRSVVRNCIAHQFGARGVIGSGYQQLVLAGDEGVMKIILGSASMTPSEMHDHAEMLAGFNDLFRAELGDGWLQTDYDIAQLGRGSVIVARQPRIDADAFVPRSIDVVPTIHSRRQAEVILGIFKERRILPDLLGHANVAVVEGIPVITDSIPAHTVEELKHFDVFRGLTVEEATLDVLRSWQN